jgi:hypothetical protein
MRMLTGLTRGILIHSEPGMVGLRVVLERI